MLDLVEAVRESADIEAVHDMRVASRRLRAALDVFAPAYPDAEFAHLQADVKAVTDSLSLARDLDVMVEALEALDDGLPAAQRAGLETFIATKRKRRKALQGKVEASLERLSKLDLAARFETIAERAGARPADPVPSLPGGSA